MNKLSLKITWDPENRGSNVGKGGRDTQGDGCTVDHEIPSWEDACKKQYAPKKLLDVFEKCFRILPNSSG